MEEKQIEPLPSKLKPPLNWVDLCLIVGGIAFLYTLLIFGTIWLAGKLPNEKVLIYVNGFLTQVFFLLLILTLKKIRKWSWSDLGWRSVSIKKIWPQILRLYLLTLLINIIYALYLYQHGFTPPSTDVYTKLLYNTTWLTYLINLLLAIVLAPLIEETLFRGIIFGGLRTYFGIWTAATISAALFSALHFQAYGFFPRFILGLVLAHLYERNRSLFPSMTFHALNNFIAMTLMAGISP
ncbi:MAG: CPBP family intramembrane glutamic endopeptidase [Desulfitobacteriaceae bacterium]